jgi:UDP-2-acetamido-3-amino-2,3-dideoxy-glucuronate N-acetyltransferase
MTFFKHESAYVDEGAIIGDGTKIWHFSHIMKGARIGERCVFGQNVNVDNGVVIGNNVKVQNNVSIYTGTTIEDDVFLGPSCVLTNVTNPRSQINRHSLYEKTLIRRGATIGANATIVCGVTLGRYCFIAAGSVVTRDVPDYALMMGNPARQKGWMSRHGHILRPEAGESAKVLKCESSKVGENPQPSAASTLEPSPRTSELAHSRTLELPRILVCPESGLRYELRSTSANTATPSHAKTLELAHSRTLELPPPPTLELSNFSTLELKCLDLDEDAPLPPEMTQGSQSYDAFKQAREKNNV